MTDLLNLYLGSPVQTGAAGLRQALVPMLDGLSRALGYDRALVALYHPDQGALRGSIGLNVPDAIAAALEVPLVEQRHPLVVALLEGTAQRVDDVQEDARLGVHDKDLLLDIGMPSFVVVPLRSALPGIIGTAGGGGLEPALDGPPAGPRGDGEPRAQGDAGSTADGPAPAGAPLPGAWQGRPLPAVGVVLLSKEQPITDHDLAWLMPFTNQAGVALAQATDAERLRRSGERYAIDNEWLWQMVNALDDPVVVTDVSNNIILQNRRAETIFRASPDDSEGKRHAIMLNNVLFTAACSSWQLEQGSGGLHRELTLVDPIEGSELLYEVIAYPATHFRLGTHGTVSVLKNVTDLRHATEQVTEHVRRLQAAESATRAERDQLDLILRSVPDPILVVDADNQIIKLNSEALRLFRSGLGRVADAPPDGRHLRRQQICLGNDAKFTSFLAQLRLDPLPVKSGELALLDPDTEEELAMWVTATEIRNNLGAVSSVVSVMHNLAPVRELERRRVQQALFDSEKLAATGRLAASIAHEINNPLEAIKNALYVLAHKLPPDDANQRMVMIASKETERVSGILRELLGFYRQPAKTVPTAVNELIEEAEQLVSALLRQRGVRLQLELSEALPPVMASADQLKQVLLNLVLNGVEAMPQGGTILIATRTTGAGEHGRLVGDAVQIQVHDTGVGIAEEHLPHIFEPFFSTKQDQKGTGLGLWVSYDIIRRHGGTLRVHSRPGRGTTFTISLPIGGMPGEGAGDEGGEGDAER